MKENKDLEDLLHEYWKKRDRLTWVDNKLLVSKYYSVYLFCYKSDVYQTYIDSLELDEKKKADLKNLTSNLIDQSIKSIVEELVCPLERWDINKIIQNRQQIDFDQTDLNLFKKDFFINRERFDGREPVSFKDDISKDPLHQITFRYLVKTLTLFFEQCNKFQKILYYVRSKISNLKKSTNSIIGKPLVCRVCDILVKYIDKFLPNLNIDELKEKFRDDIREKYFPIFMNEKKFLFEDLEPKDLNCLTAYFLDVLLFPTENLESDLKTKISSQREQGEKIFKTYRLVCIDRHLPWYRMRSLHYKYHDELTPIEEKQGQEYKQKEGKKGSTDHRCPQGNGEKLCRLVRGLNSFRKKPHGIDDFSSSSLSDVTKIRVFRKLFAFLENSKNSDDGAFYFPSFQNKFLKILQALLSNKRGILLEILGVCKMLEKSQANQTSYLLSLSKVDEQEIGNYVMAHYTEIER